MKRFALIALISTLTVVPVEARTENYLPATVIALNIEKAPLQIKCEVDTISGKIYRHTYRSWATESERHSPIWRVMTEGENGINRMVVLDLFPSDGEETNKIYINPSTSGWQELWNPGAAGIVLQKCTMDKYTEMLER